MLAIAALALLVDEKIDTLTNQRPNSKEAIADRHAAVAEYIKLKAELENIKTSITQFNKGKVKEPKVVKSVTSFSDLVRNWWTKEHIKICTKAYDMGMFATAVGICSLAGAGGPMSVAVSAALVGGKSVAAAIRGLPRNLPG